MKYQGVKKLNEKFIEKYYERLDMHEVSQKLSIDMIRKFKDEGDNVVQYQEVDQNFVIKFVYKIAF